MRSIVHHKAYTIVEANVTERHNREIGLGNSGIEHYTACNGIDSSIVVIWLGVSYSCIVVPYPVDNFVCGVGGCEEGAEPSHLLHIVGAVLQIKVM